MYSLNSLQKNQFEVKYRELLKKMYHQFNSTYKSYPLEYHKKSPISYEEFVNYCYSISNA